MCALNTLFFTPTLSTNKVLDNLITVQTAAEISGYNIQYLRRLLRTGKLDAVKIGQVWLIQLTSLETYLSHNTMIGDHRNGPKKSGVKVSSKKPKSRF
ncbi:MAG: helix-turn-helix domain-containing protein [Anaerolineales bacterium]|nr:helix-turn-helix domain-containing protein [Anaerolineales bacterium]